MAYRKVNDNSLASVADAIRSKGGTSDALVFPDGFVSAISAIQTGGSAPSLQSKSVTYTANGTATITPDEGYDGLSSVDVTVDVDAASVSTVTINCNVNDTFAFWLSPDGEFHNTRLNSSANTIIVTQYSPIGLYNVNDQKPEDFYNIEFTGTYLYIADERFLDPLLYNIFYATDITASVTFPSD